MKNLFKKINKNTKRLARIKAQIEDIKTMPYYSIFGSEQERQKDLQTCLDAQKATLNERHILLENLELETRKELMRISQNQSLKKIA